MRRLMGAAALVTIATLAAAAPALACGGLIGPNGAVNLLRTTTFAGYHDGVEHYVTAFEFAGGGGEFGSIVPLPGIPTKVERGGDWTLQRLDLETQTFDRFAAESPSASATEAASAEVLLETRIDALDITVLRGGGDEVGRWAKDHGFRLPPDAPEVLDFYADRSPIFLAAVFDADAAADRGQAVGDGTPVHLTIPTDEPWVPLRILGLGKQADEPVQADVYLLTDRRPSLLGGPDRPGITLAHDDRASGLLLSDLRSDKGMEWVPERGWLTKLRIDARAGDLKHDLAVDPTGHGEASAVDAGLVASADLPATEVREAQSPAASPPASTGTEATLAVLFVAAVAATIAVGAAVRVTAAPREPR